MGKRRKLEMTVILILMLSVILSACTGNNENGNANENQGTDDNATVGNEVTLPEKFDPPVTITQMGCINDTFKFREGESLNDNVHTRWVSENLGIKLSYISETAADQCDTKLRLAL